MGIRIRSLLVLSLLMIFGVGVQFGYVALQLNSTREDAMHSVSEDLKIELEQQLSLKSDIWQINALQIAKNERIISAMENQNREAAIAELGALGTIFRENTGFRNVEVHLIDAQLRSFLRSWDYDSYGDDLSAFESYQEVRRSRNSIVSLEPSQKGLRLKGLFPLIQGEEFLGIVNFEGGLNSIKRNLEKVDHYYLYFFDSTQASIPQGLAGSIRYGDFILSQKDFDQGFLDIVGANLTESKEFDEYYITDEYVFIIEPALDFAGNQFGVHVIGENFAEASQVVQEQQQTFFELAILGGIIVLIILLFTFAYLSRNVARPLGKFTKIFSKVAAGDMGVTIEKNDHGFLALLQDASFKMIQSLIKFLGTINDAAIQNEKQQQSLETELKRTLDATFKIAMDLTTVRVDVAELEQHIAQNNDAIGTIRGSLANVTNHVSTQSSAVSQTTAAIEQMSSSINNISNIAQIRSESGKELQKLTISGSEQVNSTLTLIDQIGKDISNVLELINIINNIASQTDLLAMNAAIEAAHAGEAGKGFAVVADEIRKLSESTKESTGQIDATLDQLATNIHTAVESSKGTSEVFMQIAEGTDSIVSSLEEINQGTSELSSGSSQVVEAAQSLLTISMGTRDSINTINEEMSAIDNTMEAVNSTAHKVGNTTISINEGSAIVNSAMHSLAESSISGADKLTELFNALKQFEISGTIKTDQVRAIERINLTKLILQHAAWVTAARSIIDRTLSIDKKDLVDHHSCGLGKWIDSGQVEGLFKTKSEFDHLNVIHEQLHKTVAVIVDLAEDDDKRAEVENQYKNLVHLSTEIISILKQLRGKFDLVSLPG